MQNMIYEIENEKHQKRRLLTDNEKLYEIINEYQKESAKREGFRR